MVLARLCSRWQLWRLCACPPQPMVTTASPWLSTLSLPSLPLCVSYGILDRPTCVVKNDPKIHILIAAVETVLFFPNVDFQYLSRTII